MAGLSQFQKAVPANTELFREGDHSEETYLLLKGEAEVLKNGQRVALINDVGTFIGEMGTLLSQPRSATVRTTADSLFVVISPIDFEKVIAAQPNIAFKLCKVLATRLQDTTNELCRLKGSSGNISVSTSICENDNSLTEDNGEDISELIENANAMYRDGNFDDAIEIYEHILEQDKDNVEIYGKLSNAFFSKGNIEKAIENMRRCVDIMPENVKFRNNLAVFYFKNKQKDEAISQWEEVVKIDPSNEKAQNNLKKLKK